MTCEEVRESLSAFLDEALSGQEQATLARHLQGCAECRRERDRLAATISLLHRVAPERAPAGFVDRVLAATRPRPWYARLVGWPGRVAPLGLPLGAAAMLLVAGLAVYLFQRSPELQQAARQEVPVAGPSETPRQEPPTTPAPPPAGQPARAPAPAPTAGRPPEAREPAAQAPSRIEGKSKGEPAGGKLEAPAVRARGDEEAGFAKQAEHARSGAPGQPQAAPGVAVEREGPPKAGADVQSPGGPKPSLAPAREKAAADTPRQALASRVPAAPGEPADIAGRLAVTDRAAAVAALADLAARIGASEIPRAAGADESLVELSLPREAYGALVEGLGTIGRWTPEREAAPLPARVRVSIRLAP